MELPSTFQSSIEKEIKAFCNSLGKPVELYEPLSYTLALGGKRIRPNLLLISSHLFKGNVKHALPVAIAIELFHNFTLIHDDITDNAPLRRNKPSVHAKWNTNIALLSGDAMMIKAYEYLAKTSKDKLPVILALFNETALKVCEGQQYDMNYETQTKVSIADYMFMISLKTAALFSASMELGALMGGASAKDAHKMKVYGESIGMLFQLQDDILDVFGEKEKTGKQTGGDIINNKKTYLLLKAIELAKGQIKKELANLLFSKDISATKKVAGVKSIYEELNVVGYANKEMSKYYKAAVNSLKTINGPGKQSLVSLCDALMSREI